LVTTYPKDVEGAVRQYASACELLGWRVEADAAWTELDGCTAATVTERRQVVAIKQWVPDPNLSEFERVEAAATEAVAGGLPVQQIPRGAVQIVLLRMLPVHIRRGEAGLR